MKCEKLVSSFCFFKFSTGAAYTAAQSHPDRCEVVVNVQKAFHLPSRAAGGGGGGRAGGGTRGGGGGARGMQQQRSGGGGGGYGNGGRGGYGDDFDGGGGGGGGGGMYGGELSPFVEVTFQVGLVALFTLSCSQNTT
jgi:hypothetical protein